MLPISSIFILLTSCAQQPVEQETLDESDIALAFEYVQPQPLLELEKQLRYWLKKSPCTPLQTTQNHIEQWSCKGGQNLQIEGSISMHSSTWIRGENFEVSQYGEMIFFFDGELEFMEHAELLQLNIAGQLCGLHQQDCDVQLHHLDMVASIYPFSAYPQNYDISVKGSFDGRTFDGSWMYRGNRCTSEATDGIFGFHHPQPQDLLMDGELRCDGCMEWSVQGSTRASYCRVLP